MSEKEILFFTFSRCVWIHVRRSARNTTRVAHIYVLGSLALDSRWRIKTFLTFAYGSTYDKSEITTRRLSRLHWGRFYDSSTTRDTWPFLFSRRENLEYTCYYILFYNTFSAPERHDSVGRSSSLSRHHGCSTPKVSTPFIMLSSPIDNDYGTKRCGSRVSWTTASGIISPSQQLFLRVRNEPHR